MSLYSNLLEIVVYDGQNELDEGGDAEAKAESTTLTSETRKNPLTSDFDSIRPATATDIFDNELNMGIVCRDRGQVDQAEDWY